MIKIAGFSSEGGEGLLTPNTSKLLARQHRSALMGKLIKRKRSVVLPATFLICFLPACSGPRLVEQASLDPKISNRKPASSGGRYYELNYQDIRVCGKVYSFPEVKSQDPELRLHFEDQILPQSELRVQLPSKLLSDNLFAAQTYYRNGPAEPPPHDLLLLLPVTSDDPQIQQRYCDSLRAVKKYFTQSSLRGRTPVVKTQLVEFKMTSSKTRGKRLRTITQLEWVNQFDVQGRTETQSIEPTAFARPGNRVDHIVIATKDYFNEAQALSQSRINSGLGSIAVNLEKIPGMQAGDPVPAQCQGVYFNECYLSASKTLQGVSFAAATGLAGMRSWNDMDDSASRKIGDAAGLVRAYLRSVKLQHPELKYVVLMGDLFQLPPRFTTRYSYYSNPDPAANFLSTDYYYADLFSVWLFSNQVTHSGINATGWPCGDECAQPNTNWDTTAFRWSLNYPMARTLADPINFNFSNPVEGAQGMANMVSVGRIIAKPPAGRSKDPAVASYVDKVSRWDSLPGDRSKLTVISGDGVYVRKNLQDFENQLGTFRYFGEGFGASFVTPANQPTDYSTADCINQPPTNDWHSYPVTSNYSADKLFRYQSEPMHCKPMDPQANGQRLPDPAEVTREVSQTGFTLMFHSAHAGYAGIGYQSDGNGYGQGRSFRNFNVRRNEGGRYSFASRPEFEDFANYQEVNGRANGFVISSGCSPSSYFGGLPAIPLFPNSGRSAGEYLVMLENAGAVGTYMNTDVGYFYNDPMFEMDLIRSMKKIGDAFPTPRFGDVTIDLFKSMVPQQIDTYQILNRVLIGDPSAKLFRKEGK